MQRATIGGYGRNLGAVALLVALAGCAAWAGDPSDSSSRYAPGAGVTPDAQVRFCGSGAAFVARVETFKAQLRAGDKPWPKSGDAACDALARLGAPNGGITAVDVRGRQELHLTYTREEVRGSFTTFAVGERILIVLAPDSGGRWIVDSVVQSR